MTQTYREHSGHLGQLASAWLPQDTGTREPTGAQHPWHLLCHQFNILVPNPQVVCLIPTPTKLERPISLVFQQGKNLRPCAVLDPAFTCSSVCNTRVCVHVQAEMVTAKGAVLRTSISDPQPPIREPDARAQGPEGKCRGARGSPSPAALQAGRGAFGDLRLPLQIQN